jgi:hypothetical protein
MNEQKVACVCYPETEEMEELVFHIKDIHAARSFYFHLMERNGVIVELKNFQPFEVDLLKASRTLSGESLCQGKNCCNK